jgi:hypothetical protein
MPWIMAKSPSDLKPRKKPHNGPASGIPARSSNKNDKTGMGWGGPASGIPAGGVRPPFAKGHKPAAGPKDPVKIAHRRLVKAAKAARIAQLTDNLCDLALNAEVESTRMAATVAALNRLEGMPATININKNVEMSFEDLVKESLKPKPEKLL